MPEMTMTTTDQRTTVPVLRDSDDLPPETRRKLSTLRASDVFAVVGAAAGAASFTAVLFTQLAPLSGVIGFFVVAYVAFIGLYALVVSFDEKATIVKDRVIGVFIHGLAALLVIVLAFILVFTVWRGRAALPHWNFYTKDLRNAGPLDLLTQGGIEHAIVGTIEQISIALVITIPLGIVCAVFMSEIPGAFARVVRTITEAMTALPSIVAGLFVYAIIISAHPSISILGHHFGLPSHKSGYAAALAISVMMLPIIIRASDVVLRLVPGSLKEASLALGSGQWRTVWHVVLPTARSGLTTAVILGTARGIGETSPVLLTAGYGNAFNKNAFSGEPQVSLPLVVFQLTRSGFKNYIIRGFGAAVVLLAMVLVLFIMARVVGGRGPGQLTRRQEHRRVLASRRDADRFGQRTGGVPSVVIEKLRPFEPPAQSVARTPSKGGAHRAPKHARPRNVATTLPPTGSTSQGFPSIGEQTA
jgi:phosphate transport system permease protein